MSGLAQTAAADPAVVAALSTEERVRQASRADTPAAVQQQLAHDPDVLVRATLSLNQTSAYDVDRTLASDGDDRVRALLAGRIARLLPNLDPSDANRATRHVRDTLTLLAADQAVRVRAAITNEVKAMASAPRDLVVVMAQDSALEVSEPLLRLSPVLTDQDLLALLATPPFPTSTESIASRPSLSAVVADAIIAHADAPAIRALLANRSASIREATLDALVGRAPHYPEWHGPLVRRPDLSLNAVRSLSQFIAADLLRVLAANPDLDQDRLEVVRQLLARADLLADDSAWIAEAHRLKSADRLTEQTVLDAAKTGMTRRLAAFLAVASATPLHCIDRVIELRSAKAIVSLVWKAGYSMRVGSLMQTALAQFSPDHILRPTANGGFPLTPEEMEWQIELISAPLESTAN